MFLPGVSETSQETQRIVDAEVRTLVENAHHEVTQLLQEHREQLESLARALLASETLDALDAYSAAGCLAQAPSQEEPGDGSRHGRQAAGVDGVSA
jgi:cell division protease FtsH